MSVIPDVYNPYIIFHRYHRMSEHYAYSQIGKVNEGWSDQIYTLTAQHMACKSVPVRRTIYSSYEVPPPTLSLIYSTPELSNKHTRV